MKNKLPHIFALILTTFILTFISEVLLTGAVSRERRREFIIEKYQIRPIFDAIDESGVDKSELANVLMDEEWGVVWRIASLLLGVAFIVYVYNLAWRWGKTLFSKTSSHPPPEVTGEDKEEAKAPR